MSLFAIFTIATMFAVSAALPENGAIRVPSENLREENAPMEKINHDLDLKAEEDDAGKVFQQLYRKHSKEPARQRPHALSILYAGRNRRSAEQPPATAKASDACSRRDMIVDTRAVIGEKVVRPVSYNAYTCAGKCEVSKNGRLVGRFENHAAVAYLMKHVVQNSTEPAEFCCVPSAYKKLPILYHDTHAFMVLRQVPNMIVTECTCVYKTNTNQAGA